MKEIIYVDWLMDHGWKYGKSCHLFSNINKEDNPKLDTIAIKIELKKEWKQKSRLGLYHYDLTESKRKLAIKNGVKEITKKEFLQLNKNLGFIK